ncbi:helix-turn-helix domain-containing protein [Marinobacter zhejiangensis]|uniref:AraC-type DNA-binding protein n=1 Tax=Marinobacter zhejiangensis TaxID=488535 RepID=A0A1I4Q7I9_9GAMM|nr:AraC family transcriptional regulator [Marinobacter zhejiangensis]SFM36014.1 AraC-type DNA-binding protein [Marinobacter zhejiangensis]
MNYVSAAAALVCLSIGVILLFASLSWLVNRQQDRLPMAYLIAMLSLIVLQSMEYLYLQTELMHRWPFFLKIADAPVVMLPFCLFGYIRALQGDNVLANWRARWLHALPMILVAALAVPFWLLPSEEQVYWLMQGRISESLWQPAALYGTPYLSVLIVLSLFYWWRQQRLGISSRKPAVQDWVNRLQLIQLIIATSLIIRTIIYYLIDWQISEIYFLAPTTAYLAYLLLTFAHLPAHIPRATTPEIKPAAASNDTPSQAAVEPEAAAHFGLLTDAMKDGLFRLNDLTLGKLAQQCGITTHQASAAINQCSGGNFYDWLNGFRIDAACEALTQSTISVTQICYDVGFNSKSTFNTAFRRITGCTPTEFRKRQTACQPPSTA